MSYNQSRVEKSDGQLTISGGRSGQNRGISGGDGGGGKSGGGGGAGHPPSSSSSNQATLSTNRSFKKSGNGQRGQPRINPASLGFETSVATATPRAVQNGAQGQPSSQGASLVPMPSGPKPGEMTMPRTSRPLPKAPLPESSGISETPAPSTPVKGDGTKPFALQFGTTSPGIVNGLQIPAWTSSAPPNLDEQKGDQARHESFSAVPTQPIPSGPKQQPQPARKEAVIVSRDSHPRGRVKREIHQQMSTVPLALQPKSAAIPISEMSMPMALQQKPMPMQFGSPGPQQMPMTLPIGNAPQIPQQMFVHNHQSHPLQPQAMIHQGQSMAFGPQISHQLGPQLGNLGISIASPQFSQQQQPGKFIHVDNTITLSGVVGQNFQNTITAPGSVGQNFRTGQGVNYGVLKNPCGQPLNQFYPLFSGPMRSMIRQGGPACNNSDADRWCSINNSRGLMPPPQTPLQVMHKAEKKYKVGKVSGKEQAKQRQLKGILNKLTPTNFLKLFQQVSNINIDNAITLSGVVVQIFDIALMEPIFCEMYASFCFRLACVLPDFTENDERISFKRLLLNKCQEEFERGEREQAEADRVDEEGGIKQSDEEREEKRIKARRRMLGNIRLIGELYKKKMLTERIMHECIQKLLGQPENPDEENLEALCKLMSTIGDQIDHAMAKGFMDAYFDAMMQLSTNQKLSSRVRFMLRDLIDLRKNRWQQRRKVEGPKKIEEVHRDAAQERQTQASRLTRGPSTNSRRGPPGDYGPRRSSVLPSPNSQIGGLRGLPTQARGYGMHDVRLDDHHPLENRTLSLPLTQRPIDDSSITLGPQGGLARGMSIRGQPSISSVPLAENPLGIGDSRRMMSGPNGYNATNDRMLYRSRGDVNLGNTPDRLSETSFDQPIFQDRNVSGNRESRVADLSYDRFSPTTFPTGRTLGSLGGNLSVASDAKPLSEEVLREKSMSTIREFYSVKDEGEVVLCIKELNSPSFYPSLVSLWVTDSFERKDMERDLLATLLVNLTKSQDSLFNQLQLTQGFESVLASLEDAVNDAPRAAEYLGRILVKVILENVVPLREIGKLIHEGGEESGSLLESGLASEVLGSILDIIKIEKGDSILKEMISSSKLRLEDFKPPHPMKSKRLDAFL